MSLRASARSKIIGALAKAVLKPSRAKKKPSKPNTKSDAKPKDLGNKSIIGWREWVSLPELDVQAINAKIDTGARTSALHAFRIRPFKKGGQTYVEFFVHPVQRRRTPEIRCALPVLEERKITSSNGRSEMRYVVETSVCIGNEILNIEITLTNRDELGFRMLVGREAIRGQYVVDPSRSYCCGRQKLRT